MSSLFKTPKIPTPTPVSPPAIQRKPEEDRAGESLYKRLAKMFGRQQTVLTGPLGEQNRKTLLGS